MIMDSKEFLVPELYSGLLADIFGRMETIVILELTHKLQAISQTSKHEAECPH